MSGSRVVKLTDEQHRLLMTEFRELESIGTLLVTLVTELARKKAEKEVNLWDQIDAIAGKSDSEKVTFRMISKDLLVTRNHDAQYDGSDE